VSGRRYLVAYDISDTQTRSGHSRLTKVAKVCAGYGVRVQRSVYECDLSETARVRMVAAILQVINQRADSVRIYRVSEDAEVFGVALELGLDDLLLI